MFPPFIGSFGDQATAVFINMLGTVFGSFFTSLFNALVANILTPLLQSIAAGAGIGGA